MNANTRCSFDIERAGFKSSKSSSEKTSEEVLLIMSQSLELLWILIVVSFELGDVEGVVMSILRENWGETGAATKVRIQLIESLVREYKVEFSQTVINDFGISTIVQTGWDDTK